MKYAIGLVGHLNPYTAEAVHQTVQFIQQATPAPSLVLFLDWAVPDPEDPNPMAGELRKVHQSADKEVRLAWYALRHSFARVGVPYHVLYPLHERCVWNQKLYQAKPGEVASLPPVHWGKQQLIEAALAAGMERLLCLPPGMWLPSDAPALLEVGIRPGVVLTYPALSVRCDLDGTPLVPTEVVTKPTRLTALDVALGRKAPHDGWWIDVVTLQADDPGRVCNFAVGDELATLTRVLHAGDGAAVSMAGFLASLPLEHTLAPQRQASASEVGTAMKLASLAQHGQRVRAAVAKGRHRPNSNGLQ